MFLSFEQVACATVQTASALTIPAEATHAELQASAQNVAYTMDNVTNPTATAAMFLLTTQAPKLFLIEDIKRIRFLQVAGGGMLNIHYLGGRNV